MTQGQTQSPLWQEMPTAVPTLRAPPAPHSHDLKGHTGQEPQPASVGGGQDRTAAQGPVSRHPAMAQGKRNETTWEGALWLGSPKPRTGTTPRLLYFRAAPHRDAPLGFLPGFNPLAPNRCCLQADAMLPGRTADANASAPSGIRGDRGRAGRGTPGHVFTEMGGKAASPGLTQQGGRCSDCRAQAGIPHTKTGATPPAWPWAYMSPGLPMPEQMAVYSKCPGSSDPASCHSSKPPSRRFSPGPPSSCLPFREAFSEASV